MLLYCRAAPPPNLGPWPCLALGEELLANRWRQHSTADRPGAQRPSQGPDIQPPTRHRHKSRSPDPSPVSLSPPRSPLLSGTRPPSLRRASAHVHHPSRALEVRRNHSLPYTSVYAHHTHTCMPHAYTLLRAHSTRTCAYTLVGTHHTQHTPHTFMYVHTYIRQHNSAKRKPCTCVCVCVITCILVGTWVSAHTSTGKLEGCERHR